MEIIERISSPEIIRENKLEDFKRLNHKTIGVVLYKDTNEEESKKAPFLSHEIILETLKEEFKEYDVLEYVIAKEMGEKKDHFHYQCVLQFKKELRQNKGYKRITVNGEKLYYLFEKGHSWKSLVGYCKKDGDFTDKDLAEIPPLKANLGLSYEYEKSKFKAEVVAVDRWSKFDDSAKEQEIAGYAVTNLKYTQELFKHFELTLGVDNLFDKVYNSTNTYQDVNYVKTGTNQDQILFNDPGRYGYVNLKYSF